MENPFLRRATEFLRDDEAFLAIVSPEPVRYHLERPGSSGTLYDRLVQLRGTPGSGKTTLARLFEFPTLCTLLRNQSFTGHKDLYAALSACGAIEGEQPRVLGCRLPMESDYRDFWEFPYANEVKTGLMASILQARTVLGWFRHLRAAGITPEQVEFVTRAESQAVLDTIGGVRGEDLVRRAGDVENRVYKVMTALVPPEEPALAAAVGSPYRPFDHIDRVRVPALQGGPGARLDLIPLAIFDDAHVLHPEQFRAFERFLVRRELRIARWIIARFDVLLPDEALAAAVEDRSDTAEYPGVTAERDTEAILLQSSGRRRKQRERFRSLAKDMATRYLRRMPLLNDKGLTVLGNVLGESDVGITPGRLRDLEERVDATQRRFRITAQQREAFEVQIRDYWGDKSALPRDVALAMLNVMMHRYEVRRGRSAQRQGNLFGAEEDDGGEDADTSIVVAANGTVFDAAVFHLFRLYERPYYYGIDSVCDASSENAELFLRLSAELVEAVATQLARSKSPTLTPATQDKLLRECGSKIMEKWDFPQDTAVRRLVEKVAGLCLDKSMEPNGAVIANAYGILQSEFDGLAKSRSDVARALQFAVAYNAVTLVPHHTCQGKEWCLLESVARYCYEAAKSGPLNVHLMVLDHPETDGAIQATHCGQPSSPHGFQGDWRLDEWSRAAKLWMPQLGRGNRAVLELVHQFVAPHAVCPILPFPATAPRSPDRLIEEYGDLFEAPWEVDARDLIYAHEKSPVDLYRTILRIAEARHNVFCGTGGSQVILSPVGSKALALGMLMAALEKNFAVVLVESLAYRAEPSALDAGAAPRGELVHIWLHGEAYAATREGGER